jgi:glycerol-3-phosphate acyltransferase PlsY
VATSLGILLGYWPYLTLPGLVGLATWGLVLLMSRYVSAASITAAALFPVYVVVFGLWWGWPPSTTWMLAAFSGIMASLIVIRHRANIKRLLAGTEPKMGQRKSDGNSDDGAARAA